MKKTFCGLMLIMGLMSLVSCDKIEPDQYTVFSGVVGEWEEGYSVENPVQRAYVEKYTGPRCTNCPAADRTLEAVHDVQGDKLVVVSVNSKTDQFGAPMTGYPDMRTPEGAVWEDFWGVSSYPTAYVNRDGATAYSGSMTSIGSAVQNVVNQSPVVAVDGEVNGSDDISIHVNLQFVQSYTKPLTLSLILIQDSLKYWQLDGSSPVADYVHNHMLRDVITDVWGADIDCTGAQGECRQATFKYTLPEGMENWHVVALISDKATRRVINSVQCE